MNSLIALSLTALLGGALWAEAAEVKLVESGESRSVIILSSEADSTEHYAARELQRGIRLATGAKVDIVTAEAGPKAGVARILIGTSREVKAMAPSAESLPSADSLQDDVLVNTKDDSILLVGSNSRSALYATYRFMEEALGFRWFWPGETGEYYRVSKDLSVENLKLQESGAVRYRYLAINAPHYDEETLVWMSRNRMNVHPVVGAISQRQLENLHEKGLLARYAGHNLTLPDELLKEHPEYLAEYGGRRTLHHSTSSHLCWSNEGVQRELIDVMKGWVKAHPKIDIWSFYPADQTHFCQCAGCMEMAPDVSTRFQKLSEILIKALRAGKPDLNVSTLGYQSYRDVPKETASFDSLFYATYNVSYRHFLRSGHPSNQSAIEEMRRWKALGTAVGIRAYDMIIFDHNRWVPNVSYMVDAAAFVKEEGLVGYNTEVTPYGHPKKHPLPEHQQNWVTSRMNLYALAQALWKKDVSAGEIVGDWTRAIYGEKGGEAMERYYFAAEKAWRSAPANISYFLNPSPPYARGFISRDLVNVAAQAFKDARTAIANEVSEPARQRALAQVELEEKMFNDWKSAYIYLAENADRFQVTAEPTMASEEELMNPASQVWENAVALPTFEGPKGKPEEPTEVRVFWKEGTLYLRAICHEAPGSKRTLRFREHDQDVWGDDCLELFVNSEKKGGYYHLAVNSVGARYDAHSAGGMSLDLSANPKWEAKTIDRSDGWATVVALPLAELGVGDKAGSEVDLSVRRTRPGGTASGWPDASVHSPGSAGTILLSASKVRHVLLYRGDREKSGAMEVGFNKRGWRVDYLESEEDFHPEKCDVIFLRYGLGKGFALTPEFMLERVKPWVEEGGMLVVTASQPIPSLQWFGRDDLVVKWSGWDISVTRRSAQVMEGEWMSRPNALENILRKSVTPSSAFEGGEGWEVLATLRMKDDSERGYILRTREGKGQIVLTSSNMGYGGGHEMFGNQNPENVVMLIENLYHAGTATGAL